MVQNIGGNGPKGVEKTLSTGGPAATGSLGAKAIEGVRGILGNLAQDASASFKTLGAIAEAVGGGSMAKILGG